MTTPLGIDDPEFVAVVGGKVHLLPPRESEQAAVLVRFGDVSDELALSLALGTLIARCGTHIDRHRGGFNKSAEYVSAFDDERLCRRCYLTVPEDERGRLFEHAA